MPSPHPKRANRPHVVGYHIRAQGLNDSDLTIEDGVGIKSIARVSEGLYRITWQQDPGLFINATYGLQAATPSDLKGHTVVFDTYDSTNLQLDFNVFNASDATDDLLVNEYIDLVIAFSEHGN